MQPTVGAGREDLVDERQRVILRRVLRRCVPADRERGPRRLFVKFSYGVFVPSAASRSRPGAAAAAARRSRRSIDLPTRAFAPTRNSDHDQHGVVGRVTCERNCERRLHDVFLILQRCRRRRGSGLRNRNGLDVTADCCGGGRVVAHAAVSITTAAKRDSFIESPS